jgi:hypothetical protein
MTTRGLNVDAFVAAMEAKCAEYGAAIFPARVAAWRKLGGIFDQELRRQPGGMRPWPVFCGALGIGKTTGAEVCCRMLPPDVGALVIVRTIRQAERFAANVGPSAYAYHSALDPKPAPTTLAQHPTLVICHRGYTQGLNHLALEQYDPKFTALHAFNGGRRSLVIVDEAMDQVVEEKVSRRALMELRARIPGQIELTHRLGVATIDQVVRLLLEQNGAQHRNLSDEELAAWLPVATSEADVALLGLANALSDRRTRLVVRRRQDPAASAAAKREAVETLVTLRHQLHYQRWLYNTANTEHRALVRIPAIVITQSARS